MAGRVQNLKPWPKGVSGNPAGRPKNDISVEIARAVFENNPEAIYRAMARRLMKGDARVFKVLAERAYGKVKQEAEGDSWEIVVEHLQAGRRRVAEGLSEAELRDRIEDLQRQLAIKTADAVVTLPRTNESKQLPEATSGGPSRDGLENLKKINRNQTNLSAASAAALEHVLPIERDASLRDSPIAPN